MRRFIWWRLSALWFGVTHIVRFNVMGYFLLAAMMALVPGAIDLLEQPNPYFHANGYAVIAFALAMLAWPLIYWAPQTASPASVNVKKLRSVLTRRIFSTNGIG